MWKEVEVEIIALMVTSIKEGGLFGEDLTGKSVPLEMARSGTKAPVGLMGNDFVVGPKVSESLII